MYKVGSGSRSGLAVAAIGMLMAFLTCVPGQAAQVCVAWDPPTHSVDGQPLQDLAGYRIYYGTNSQLYSSSITLGVTNMHLLSGLNGTSTYYIAITAFNSDGMESGAAGEMMWSGLDTDGDGMADLWEQLHLGAIASEYGLPTADADGDGLSNLSEFIAGMNPTNMDGVVDMETFFTNNQMQVRFNALRASGTGYTGKTRYYALERCTNIASGTWSVVPGYGAILATNQPVTYAAGATAGATMCRARVWLQ